MENEEVKELTEIILKTEKDCKLNGQSCPESGECYRCQAESIISAGFHRSVPDKELREKMLTAPRINTCVKCPYWNTCERTEAKSMSSVAPTMLCELEVDQILALLPSRPEPPEKVVEAIKKIVDEILVEEALIALNFDKKKIEDAEKWSALQIEANYKLREKAVNSIASLTPELTLISDEEIEAKIRKELTGKLPRNRHELLELIIDIIHITKQAQLAADQKKMEG